MAFCPNCGAQASGSFCPNCGTPLGSASAQPGGFTPSSAYNPAVGSSSGLSDNLAGALCYTPFVIGLIVSIVLLVIAPYNTNRNVRFHAFQSLFLHLALFLLSIALSLLIGMVALATHGIGFLMGGLYPIIWLATLILFIYLMYQTYNRQKVVLPFVGELAAKQA